MVISTSQQIQRAHYITSLGQCLKGTLLVTAILLNYAANGWNVMSVQNIKNLIKLISYNNIVDSMLGAC